jgi:hypothetical protein
LSHEHRWRRESVDRFYCDHETVLAAAHFDLDYRFGLAALPGRLWVKTGIYACGPFQGGDSGVKDASLVGRHGGALSVQ